MKKKILTLVLALTLTLGGGMMLACGEKQQSKISTDHFATVINEMKQDNEVFETGTVQGQFSTEFILSDMKGTGFDYYSQILSIPMEYIDRYKDDMTQLSKLKITKEAKSVKNALEINTNLLQESFERLSEQAFSLNKFTEATPNAGVFLKYQQSCLDFMDKAYNVAYNVAELEDVALGNISAKQVTEQALTLADSNRIKDYLLLDLARDLYSYLIVNAQGQLNNLTVVGQPALQQVGVNNAYLDLLSACSAMVEDSDADLTGELANEKYNNTKVTELLQMQEIYAKERENFAKSMKNFSLDKYISDYELDGTEYLKNDSVKNATTYINFYFNELQPAVQDYYLNIL